MSAITVDELNNTLYMGFEEAGCWSVAHPLSYASEYRG